MKVSQCRSDSLSLQEYQKSNAPHANMDRWHELETCLRMRKHNLQHLPRSANSEKNIQNEVITLIGHKTLEAVMERVKHSNYYLVMMDCAHTAALCNSVLCQIKSRVGATVGKHFASFLPLSDTVVK